MNGRFSPRSNQPDDADIDDRERLGIGWVTAAIIGLPLIGLAFYAGGNLAGLIVIVAVVGVVLGMPSAGTARSRWRSGARPATLAAASW